MLAHPCRCPESGVANTLRALTDRAEGIVSVCQVALVPLDAARYEQIPAVAAVTALRR